jgi:hypothetical protein
MSSQPGETKKAKVIKASTLLQAKIGRGPLDENTIKRCQEVLDKNEIDFAPLADSYLTRLLGVIKKAESGALDKTAAIQAMIEPVMQLKAHAAIFRYPLVGNLANIMMGFLESIGELDENVIKIVEAHHQTLRSIIMKEMKGDGGEAGKMLEKELMQACNRYHAKKK